MTTHPRKILITGVTHGIGEALLKKFIQIGGLSLAGGARSKDKLEQLSQQYPEVWLAPLDVSSADSVRQWSQKLLAEWGTPDLLIHNAGTIHPNAFLTDLPIEEMHRTIDVNVKGTFLVNQALLPSLLKQERGVIVNVSSGAGRQGFENMTAYCAAKWAVEGFSAALAQELPRGIGVVTLSPGLVNTRMLQTTFGQEMASHQVSPEQWAEKAAPILLAVTPDQNGQQLTIALNTDPS